jgi:hypothetical protein
VNVLVTRKSWKGEREKGKVERDYNVGSEFSPGNYVCMSAVEELKKKGKRGKLKGKRDYNVGSEFSPGCERIGTAEELERKKLKGKRGKLKGERGYN